LNYFWFQSGLEGRVSVGVYFSEFNYRWLEIGAYWDLSATGVCFHRALDLELELIQTQMAHDTEVNAAAAVGRSVRACVAHKSKS
jgi:hypothetical protein